jgi:hypothetical protein
MINRPAIGDLVCKALLNLTDVFECQLRAQTARGTDNFIRCLTGVSSGIGFFSVVDALHKLRQFRDLIINFDVTLSLREVIKLDSCSDMEIVFMETAESRNFQNSLRAVTKEIDGFKEVINTLVPKSDLTEFEDSVSTVMQTQ